MLPAHDLMEGTNPTATVAGDPLLTATTTVHVCNLAQVALFSTMPTAIDICNPKDCAFGQSAGAWHPISWMHEKGGVGGSNSIAAWGLVLQNVIHSEHRLVHLTKCRLDRSCSK
mmetsp:Transcript_112923/g.196032  ORF Transcript_112923/g.196032 Transcript_112923/m.196032 type:complete len:114 (+) Transcript_112923:872-1213(+)